LAFFSVESGASLRGPTHPYVAGKIAGKQGCIESTMEVGPLNQTTQAPAPEENPGRLVPPPHYPPVWAQRLLLGIEVAIAVWAGILVLVLPWTRLWTGNSLLAAWPSVRFFLNMTFIRGMISGVGLVDLWMGVHDALHYRDLR
jgi:hypothetical protein